MQKLFGAYIHWPYCLSKCPYCDFASTAVDSIDETTLLKSYLRDISFFQPYVKAKPLTSVFFGGGTPSLMSSQLCHTLLDSLEKTYGFSHDIEITIEANPDAVDLDKMRAFRTVGVNRLSLGVQSLNTAGLKQLGRRHTLKTALDRIEQAQSVFNNVSIDLIYARPNQTPTEWRQELSMAAELGLPHYSCYQLTIESGTPFAKRHIQPADDEIARTLYLETEDFMNKNNTPSYEVSNYARTGFECRHNLTYWLGDDYLGIGPAAHGRLGSTASENARFLHLWQKQPPRIEQLTDTERALEKLMMHLRLKKIGYPIEKLPAAGVQTALQNGWLKQRDNLVYPTTEGTLMLNSLILLLMPA